jgi:hypothetical protein
MIKNLDCLKSAAYTGSSADATMEAKETILEKINIKS